MKKLIDVSEEQVRQLKIIAANDDTSVKRLMEKTISDFVIKRMSAPIPPHTSAYDIIKVGRLLKKK